MFIMTQKMNVSKKDGRAVISKSDLSTALRLSLVFPCSQLSAEVSEWRGVCGSQHLPLLPGVARHAVPDP